MDTPSQPTRSALDRSIGHVAHEIRFGWAIAAIHAANEFEDYALIFSYYVHMSFVLVLISEDSIGRRKNMASRVSL